MLDRKSASRHYVSGIIALVAVLTLALTPWSNQSPVASADPADTMVLDWNRYAVEALSNLPTASTPGAGQTPTVAILHLAMVQGAVYDAVNMIDGGYQPYLADLPPASASASQAAAVATAAHHTLTGMQLVPPLSGAIVDRLDALLADSLALATDADGPAAVAAGIAVGEAAAAAMLAERADDGRYGSFAFPVGTAPGEWRPTPPAFLNDPFGWVVNVDPFLLESASQVRTKGPRALHTGIYAKEYNEVKTLGSIDSVRSPEQEAIAQFFTVNTAEHYNRTFRTVAADEGLTTSEQARLFAMLNMAGADALIGCHDDKAFWGFWRPITAIRLGDEDGNPKTVGDPAWTPMLANPPYPDHPSGHNCATAGFMYAAEVFFGRGRMDFSLVRIVPGQADVVREYKHFRDVVDDTIDARIYQGLHFRTADVQGAGIGRDVARWLEQNYFQPVN